MQHEFDRLIPGNGLVGIEVTKREVGARRHCQAEVIQGSIGEGASTAHGRCLRTGTKAVVVGGTRFQAVDHNLYGVVALLPGCATSALQGVIKGRVLSDFPLALGDAGCGGQPRPQYNRAVVRVSACYAVLEDAIRVRGSARHTQPDR